MGSRLLVIDDDDQLLAVVGDYLKSLGYDVHRAMEQEEAEALLNNYAYSLVITDLSLTKVGIEGLDLLKKMSELIPRPRIIVMSGHSSPDHREATAARGANVFLQKPFPIRELGKLVNEFVGA
jgi:DNA-binding NtrC family response regulator